MMIKVSGGFLDFNGEVEVERQAKLFENLDETRGDFSYQFSIAKTQNNLTLLGLPVIDNAAKSIYQKIDADLMNDQGEILYPGYLLIEGIDSEIQCSFFSGNSNWIRLISGNVNDLDFSAYDTTLTSAGIIASFANTSGLVFPLVDNGGLITRGAAQLKPEDFNGAMYVKTIFQKIFNAAGLKLKGEILNDWVYNNAIVCKNNKNEEELNAGACYVQKTTTLARPVELDFYKLTWDNDSTYPYFNGSAGYFNLTTDKFTAGVKMKVRVECTLEPQIKDASYSQRIYIYINGAYPGFVEIGDPDGSLYAEGYVGTADTHTLDRIITLESGDELELYSQWQQSTGSTQNDILNGTMRITPLFLYEVKGISAVPAWTCREFIMEYLKLFNTIIDYDPYSKEVTINFFKNIRTKTPIDISTYVSNIRTDFTELISNFGQNNYFNYEESDDEELREYNVNKFLKYGAGNIEVDNYHIDEGVNIIDSKFKAPISYINDKFQASLERTALVSLAENQSTTITSVTDNGFGAARVNITDNYYLVGDMIRIKDSDNPNYNGDHIVSVVASGYIECHDLPYFSSSTGNISRLDYEYGTSEDVFLMINIPNYDSTNFGDNFIEIEGTTQGTYAYSYFNLLTTGKTVNTNYKQGLSFGSVVSNFFYQKTLLESYWANVQDILNDPVKVLCDGHFPEQVFRQLTPLTPVYIKSNETVNTYYINLITGYKGSSTPCEVELIKLP